MRYFRELKIPCDVWHMEGLSRTDVLVYGMLNGLLEEVPDSKEYADCRASLDEVIEGTKLPREKIVASIKKLAKLGFVHIRDKRDLATVPVNANLDIWTVYKPKLPEPCIGISDSEVSQ